MSATTIMFLAIVVALVGRWAHNQTTVTAKGVVGAIFALVFVGVLDHGNTEQIAKGFAWLFLVAVLLSNNSPLTGISNVINKSSNTPPKKG